MLTPTLDGQGVPKIDGHLAKFGDAVEDKLKELGHDEGDGVQKLYEDVCAAIQHAVETTLPVVKRLKQQQREVSTHTKELIDKRSDGKRRTKQEFDDLQAAIK